MTNFVIEDELASFLRVSNAQVAGFQRHLDLAIGLVSDEIGSDTSSWPTAATTTILASAARAYYNPEGLRSETVGGVTATRDSAALGVYLTDAEIARLHRATDTDAGTTGPSGDFPDSYAAPWASPDAWWLR